MFARTMLDSAAPMMSRFDGAMLMRATISRLRKDAIFADDYSAVILMPMIDFTPLRLSLMFDSLMPRFFR